MTFRDRLLETLRTIESVLRIEGVMVIGSEVPNLLQADAASTLVVSQDVDVGVPVSRLDDVQRLVANLAVLSLLRPVAGMPGLRPERARLASLLHRLVRAEAGP